MSALALEFAQSPADASFENAATFRKPERLYMPQPAVGEVDCNRFLWLQIAILAPMSGALWGGIAYGGFRLVSHLVS